MIVASFVGVVVEVQYQPVSGSNLHSILGILEVFFTMIFVVDLCFNFYAHYFWLFMKNPWNVLDVVIVFISVLSLIIQVGLHELTALNLRVGDCYLFRILPPSPGPSNLYCEFQVQALPSSRVYNPEHQTPNPQIPNTGILFEQRLRLSQDNSRLPHIPSSGQDQAAKAHRHCDWHIDSSHG